MSVRILIGDVRDKLAELEPDSIDCVVTSPPYWGLRDYGTGSWEGGNVECLHQPTRGYQGATGQRAGRAHTQRNIYLEECRLCGAHRRDLQIGLEPSWQTHVETIADVFDLFRRALKPQGTLWLNYGDSYATSVNGRSAADTKATGNDDRTFRDKPFSTVGGVLKPKDLCGIPWRVAFALQERGWWLRQDIIWSKPNPMPESIRDRCTKAHEYLFLLAKSERYWFDAEAIAEPAAFAPRCGWDDAPKGSFAGQREDADNRKVEQSFRAIKETRNKRSVWHVPTQSFPEAHFATFPPALIEPCILAGCPVGGTVLDPFFGAGTTGLVADRLGRNCIGIELNPEYAEIAERRITGDAGMFAEVLAA